MLTESNGIPLERSRVQNTQQQVRAARFELLVVSSVCVLPLTLNSMWLFLDDAQAQYQVSTYTHWIITSIVESWAGVFLVAYLRFVRVGTTESLGFRLVPSVIPRSIGVFLLGLLTYLTASWLSGLAGITGASQAAGGSVAHMAHAVPPLLWLLRILTSAIFEETLVRAYIMTRIIEVGWGKVTAVLTSTVIQASYHTYQGLEAAGLYIPVFIVFSVFYVRYRNALVLVLAHFYLALLWWAIA